MSTMERITPDELGDGSTGQETLRLHMERYEFAARHLVGTRVLDAACGVGYGTCYLAGSGIPTCVGVDIDEEAIRYARTTYASPVVAYVVADATTYRESAPFHAVVSLETIEHVPNPRGLVENLVANLAPGGRLIASAPVTPSMDANPHHLSDFTPRSFRRLFDGLGLVEIDSLLQVQPFSATAVATRSEERMQDLRPSLLRYYAAHPGKLALRVWSTVRYGFTNRYLTLAMERRG